LCFSIHDSLFGGLLDVSWDHLKVHMCETFQICKGEGSIVPCPRPLFWESWSSLCPTLFEGHDKSSSTATLFNAQLGTLFSRMGIRFCSLLADFSFFKYVFQSGRFAGSNSLQNKSESKNRQFQFLERIIIF
jgi:hypothetical protein